MIKEKKIIGAKYIIQCCPKCSSEKVSSYQTLMSYPPLYCYICEDCAEKWTASDGSPYIKYIFEEDIE